MIKAPATQPCVSCPYRRDVPSGAWDEGEYDKLPAYDEDTAGQPHGVFLCHQRTGRVCSGWAGCHDMDNSLALRLAGATGAMDVVSIEATRAYESPVPLFASGADARAHGLADIEHPGDDARALIDKLARRDRKERP